MKVLLDTQVFLWMHAEAGRLGRLKSVILDSSNDLFLSAASAWEIAIKHGVGKLNLPEIPRNYVPSRMLANGIRGLEILHTHALAMSSLPLHHRDPFDRLLVAQCEIEDMSLATADPVFNLYSDRILSP